MRLAHDLSEFDPPPALGQSRSCEQPVTAVIPTTNENENTLGRCPIRHDLIDGSAQQKLLSFSCDGLSGNVHEVLSRVGIKPPLLSCSGGLGGTDTCHDDPPSAPPGALAADWYSFNHDDKGGMGRRDLTFAEHHRHRDTGIVGQ